MASVLEQRHEAVRGSVEQQFLRAFVPDAAFSANGFQDRFAWNNASDTPSIETLKALPSGPDITGLEDALFSLMH